MNPIKKKLARMLLSMGKSGMKQIDPKSSCAKKIKNDNSLELLKEDINRICEELSLGEAMKIIKISSTMQFSSDSARDNTKDDIKKISLKVVKRVESSGKKLNFPVRHNPLRLFVINPPNIINVYFLLVIVKDELEFRLLPFYL